MAPSKQQSHKAALSEIRESIQARDDTQRDADEDLALKEEKKRLLQDQKQKLKGKEAKAEKKAQAKAKEAGGIKKKPVYSRTRGRKWSPQHVAESPLDSPLTDEKMVRQRLQGLGTGSGGDVEMVDEPTNDWEAQADPEEHLETDRETVSTYVGVNAIRDAQLRAPIVVVLGHVDTGKTTLLDNLRATNVQRREVGGITQRIGATLLPSEEVHRRTAMMHGYDTSMRIPGFLVIDTPGHAPFEQLRARGATLCDIGVVIVDITKPKLEEQTLNSLKLLRARRKPFVVLVNKVDRLYGWQSNTGTDIMHGEYPIGSDFKQNLDQQPQQVRMRFDHHLANVKLALAEEGLNSELYYEYTLEEDNVPLVPASGKYSEGIPSLLWFLGKYAEQHLAKSLRYSPDVDCTVLEVGKFGRRGWAVDAILKNGELKRGNTIALWGESGPIIRSIQSLFTEDPLLPSSYVDHLAVKGATGIKIGAQDIQDTVAETPIVVVDEHRIKDPHVIRAILESMGKPATNKKSVAKGGAKSIATDDGEELTIGMRIHAPTKNLAATMKEILHGLDVPVLATSIGTPLSNRDVKMAEAANESGYKEYAVVLCVEHVKIPPYVRKTAQSRGVTILEAGTCYEMEKAVKQHFKDLKAEKRKKGMVFPCELQPLGVDDQDENMFTVNVMEGSLHLHTRLIAFRSAREGIKTLGKV